MMNAARHAWPLRGVRASSPVRRGCDALCLALLGALGACSSSPDTGNAGGGSAPYEQACYYCQAASVCDCAGDSGCAAQNRQSAASLGTTCP